MAEDPALTARRHTRRWLVATWISGAVLAICVVGGLSAMMSRTQKAFALTDDVPLDHRTFEEATNRSLFLARASLVVGTASLMSYFLCYVMFQRTKGAERSHRTSSNHLDLPEVTDK